MGRDAVIILAMRIAGTVLWMGYTIALARGLSPPDFATALYVMNFSFLAVLVITLGRDVALLKFTAHHWAAGNRRAIRKVLRRTRLVLLCSGGVMTLALLLAAQAGLDTPVTRDWQLALLSGLLTVAGAQMGVNRDCLRAIGKVWQSQLGLNLTRSVIPLVGSGIAYTTTGLTVTGALGLFLASLVLSVALEEAVLRRVDWTQGDATPKTGFAEITRASLSLWPGDIANALQMRAAGLIAGLMLTPELTALFLAAERVSNLAQFPIAAAAQAAAPQIARIAGRGSSPDLQSALSQASVLLAVGALIGVAGAGLLAYPALWALGPDFLAALPVVLLLIAGHASWCLFGLAQTTLNLTGQHKTYSAIAGICSGIGVCLMWAGFARYGAVGGAGAFCLTWWLTNLACTLTLRLRTGLRTGVTAIDRQSVTRALRNLAQRRPR